MLENEMNLTEIVGDNRITLEELRLLIPKLQKKYGKRATIRFDAGYNNVQVVVAPTKKQ